MNVTDKMLEEQERAMAELRRKARVERDARAWRDFLRAFVIAALLFAAGIVLIVSNVRV